MKFTKEQISELMCKHAQKENGLHDLLEIMIESMMVAERGEFLSENQGDKGNGYRPGHAYGHGKNLSSASPETATVTSIRVFWPSFATRRRNATVLQASSTPRG